MGFTPLAFLIIVDIILAAIAIFFKVRQRFKRRSASQADRAYRKSTHFTPAQANEYSQLTTDTEYHGIEDGSVALESRMPTTNPRRPTGFEHLGAMDSNSTLHEQYHDPAPTESTDLHLFVQSLKKCFGTNTMGLGFEFENLKFQPPKATKPILDDVSGLINAGSLWGVMGASGAGKCKFIWSFVLNQLLTKP
jgi:hypothetical protein